MDSTTQPTNIVPPAKVTPEDLTQIIFRVSNNTTFSEPTTAIQHPAFQSYSVTMGNFLATLTVEPAIMDDEKRLVSTSGYWIYQGIKGKAEMSYPQLPSYEIARLSLLEEQKLAESILSVLRAVTPTDEKVVKLSNAWKMYRGQYSTVAHMLFGNTLPVPPPIIITTSVTAEAETADAVPDSGFRFAEGMKVKALVAMRAMVKAGYFTNVARKKKATLGEFMPVFCKFMGDKSGCNWAQAVNRFGEKVKRNKLVSQLLNAGADVKDIAQTVAQQLKGEIQTDLQEP